MRARGKPLAQIAEQRLVRLGEPDEADAAVGGADQQPTERAVGEGGADHLAFAAATHRARRHAEQLAGLLVDAAFRAIAGFGHRVGHAGPACQGRVQPTGAHTLGIAARRQTGVVAEHAQEVEARVAGTVRQRVQRRNVLGRLDEGTGVLHHCLREPCALALRVAALAGSEPGRLRLADVAKEPDVLAQRTRRRTAGPAVHAHRADSVEEVSRLAANDLVPELIVRQPIDRVCVFHAPILVIPPPVRHPYIAVYSLLREGPHRTHTGSTCFPNGRSANSARLGEIAMHIKFAALLAGACFPPPELPRQAMRKTGRRVGLRHRRASRAN